MKLAPLSQGAQDVARRMGVDLNQIASPGTRLDERQAKALLTVADLDRSGFIDAPRERQLLPKLLGGPEAVTAEDAPLLQEAAARANQVVEHQQSRMTDLEVNALGSEVAALVNSLWYGGGYAHGASVSGIYSEKASTRGQPGIGHPRFATTATGGDLVLSVTGLYGKNPQPTRVLALDSDKILKLNGGVWPGTPEEMKAFLARHGKEVILKDVMAQPPSMTRISGIPAGTRVTVLTGAEAILGNPPRSPPSSQAMVTNLGQLPAPVQAMLGGAPALPPSKVGALRGELEGARQVLSGLKGQWSHLDAQIRAARAQEQVMRARGPLDAAQDVAARTSRLGDLAAELGAKQQVDRAQQARQQMRDQMLDATKLAVTDARGVLATIEHLRRDIGHDARNPSLGQRLAMSVPIVNSVVGLKSGVDAQWMESELGRAEQLLKGPVNELARNLRLGAPLDPVALQGQIDRVRLAIDSASLHVRSVQTWRGSQTHDFIASTQSFRSTLELVQARKDELAGMSPSDPGHARAKQALRDAEDVMKLNSGYTAERMPAPGTLWVDPQFLSAELPGGKVTAQRFPVNAPVLTAPTAEEMLFGKDLKNPRPIALIDSSGRQVIVRTMEEYQAFVKTNREDMPRKDGEPVAVHVSLEGGGGKGKRYGAAYAELLAAGVVGTDFSGSSAGSIASILFAAGADPARVDRFMKSLGDLKDFDLVNMEGGLANGQKIFDALDQELRILCGKPGEPLDRPATFADLKAPVKLTACKTFDSQPPLGQEDMSQLKNRLFVFSQETTPNTPVVLGARASMAIPGVFDPVDMVDPVTGRHVQLVDGGVLDNLPMDYQGPLPAFGLSLAEPLESHPDDNTKQPRPLPSGNVDVTSTARNGVVAVRWPGLSAVWESDYRDRAHPAPGHFMLELATWDLDAPERGGDSTFGLEWDPEVDPVLDGQTRETVHEFLRQHIADIGKPGASGTNTPPLPEKLRFQVEIPGTGYLATYAGGDTITFSSSRGERIDARVGQHQIEAMWIDGQRFGHLGEQFRLELARAKSTHMRYPS